MKMGKGRPVKSSKNLSDFKNPRLVIIESCSKSSYWYSNRVGHFVIVCDDYESGSLIKTLSKTSDGKFAYNRCLVHLKDIRFIAKLTN